MGVLASTQLVTDMKVSQIILIPSAVTATSLSVNVQDDSSSLGDIHWTTAQYQSCFLASNFKIKCGIKKPARLGYGCYKSTCWAYCGASWTSGEWCYTGSKSAKTYKSCNSYLDCYTKDLDKCHSGCSL